MEEIKLVPKRNVAAIDDEYLQEVADICANHPRMTYKQLSVDILGQAENYLYDLRSRHPQLKEMMRQTTLDRFEELAKLAQQTIIDLMVNSENDNVRLASAKDYLSRGAYDAVQKVENTNKDITVELVNDDED